MELKEVTSERLKDIVVRLKRTSFRFVVENLDQLRLTSELKSFMLAALVIIQDEKFVLSNTNLLNEIKAIGDISEIHEIVSTIEVEVIADAQKKVDQYKQNQINFFCSSQSAVKKNEEPTVLKDKVAKQSFHSTFGLPRIVANFTGREKELSDLKQNRWRHGSQWEANLISGTGGIGKTQLALVAAHDQLREYKETKGQSGCQSVIWLIAGTDEAVATEDLMNEQFRRFAQELGIYSNDLHMDILVRKVYQSLEADYSPYMIVFDNAPNYFSLKPYLPPHGNVFITTKNSSLSDWSPSFKNNSLGVFTESEAINYIYNFLSMDHLQLYHKDSAKDLAEALSRFPLALTQALGFITTHNISIQTFLQDFSKKREEYYQYPVSQGDPYHVTKSHSNDTPQVHMATVWSVIQLSLMKVVDARAIQTLKFCAYLAPEYPIHLNLLLGKNGLGDMCQCLTTLRQLCLLENTDIPENLRIHQLVQEIVRFRNSADKKDFLIELTQVIVSYWYQLIYIERDGVKTLDIKADDIRKRRLLQHLLSFLGWLTAEGAVTPTWGINERAHIKFFIGAIYTRLGDYVRSSNFYKEALSDYKQAKNQEKIISVTNNLASIQTTLGKYFEAARSLEALLDMKFVIEDTVMAKVHTNLAAAYHAAGEPHKAFPHYYRALELKEKSDKPTSEINIDVTHRNLGECLNEIGQPAQAKIHLDRAYNINEKALKTQNVQEDQEDHLSLTWTLHPLGDCEYQLGNLEVAHELLRRCLNIQKREYGPSHILIAETLRSLADVQRKKGLNVDAQRDAEEALSIQVDKPIEAPHRVADTLAVLGHIYGSSRDWRERGIFFLKSAIDIYRLYYNESHISVARARERLAEVFKEMGDVDQEIEILRKVFPIYAKFYGDHHIKTIVVQERLSQLSSLRPW